MMHFHTNLSVAEMVEIFNETIAAGEAEKTEADVTTLLQSLAGLVRSCTSKVLPTVDSRW